MTLSQKSKRIEIIFPYGVDKKRLRALGFKILDFMDVCGEDVQVRWSGLR